MAPQIDSCRDLTKSNIARTFSQSYMAIEFSSSPSRQLSNTSNDEADRTIIQHLEGIKMNESFLLLYLTEGIFDDESCVEALSEVLRLRAEELQQPTIRDPAKSLSIVCVAETDMRHGWSEHASEHANDNWQCAVSRLASHPVFIDFCRRGWLDSMLLHNCIPFYKDKCFRDVSIQQILISIGAQSDAPDIASEQYRSVSNGDSDTESGRLQRTNSGSAVHRQNPHAAAVLHSPIVTNNPLNFAPHSPTAAHTNEAVEDYA